MSRWKQFASVIGGRRVVVALGGAYLVIAVAWATVLVAERTPAGSVAIVSFMIGAPGLLVCYGGYRLPASDVRPEFYPDVARACLVGLGVMLALLGLYHVQPGDSLEGSFQTVLILTSLATAAGFAVGVHDARAKTRARILEERNRELRRTQAELERTVDRLRASNERLEQFAHAASHDLQEPLRMVSSYLQLVERRADDELSAETREFLEYAVDGAERMREMIDGLLAYSRVESRGTSFEPVDLDRVLEEALADLRVKIDESDAEIVVEDALPRVEGDPGQVRQVFQNLVSNAIEYSDGRPRVTVSADCDDSQCIVSVSDEGVGIDPADRDRIFEVFERLHARDEHPGSGIGLALCRRIVERHGGEIWVESDPGEGATFSFTLPVNDGETDG